MMEQEGQSTKLVFYPWPRHKPFEQERDPCSVRGGSRNVPLVLEKTTAGIQSFQEGTRAQLPLR